MKESGEKNLGVGPQTLVLQVVEVVVESKQHLFHSVGIAVVQSSIGSHSGAYGIQFGIARIVLHNLVDIEFAFRTVANESHVALEHVPQLWQFVEMMCTHPFASLSESRVAQGSIEQQLRTILLGIDAHTTELVDIERLAMQTYALLTVYNGHSVLTAYCHITYGKQWGKYHKGYRGENEIYKSLHLFQEK